MVGERELLAPSASCNSTYTVASFTNCLRSPFPLPTPPPTPSCCAMRFHHEHSGVASSTLASSAQCQTCTRSDYIHINQSATGPWGIHLQCIRSALCTKDWGWGHYSAPSSCPTGTTDGAAQQQQLGRGRVPGAATAL